MDTNALLDLSHHRADIARLKQLLLEQSQETSSSSSPPDQDHAATDSHSDDQEIEPQLMMTGMAWVKTPHHPRVYESRIGDTRSYALARDIMPRTGRAKFQRKRPRLPPIVRSSCAPSRDLGDALYHAENHRAAAQEAEKARKTGLSRLHPIYGLLLNVKCYTLFAPLCPTP